MPIPWPQQPITDFRGVLGAVLGVPTRGRTIHNFRTEDGVIVQLEVGACNLGGGEL